MFSYDPPSVAVFPETEKWKNLSSHQVKEVGSEDIAEVVSSWTGIPATQITKEE